MTVERLLENAIFASRWLQVPMYIGLIGGLLVVTAKFALEFAHLVPRVLGADEAEVIIGVLALVDMVLVANLLLMVLFSGYENFVSKLDLKGHEDVPDWLGHIDINGLKLKLITSIVAISSIQLLKGFYNVGTLADRELMWMLVMHIAFVSSGVLMALMDRLSAKEAG
jgi:uncharacterized protein (TIGR00645 family)